MKKRIPNGLLLVFGGLLWAAVVLGTRARSFSQGALSPVFLQQHSGYEVALASCIFLLCKQNLNRKPKSRLLPDSRLMFGVYLSHSMVLNLLYFYKIRPAGFWDSLGLAVFVFFVSYLVVKLLASVKGLSLHLAGIPYSAPCNRGCRFPPFRKKP